MKVVLCLVCAISLMATVESKTALVINGGGAKGSISVGFLKALCESELRNSWDMVVGTSIGSMFAGVLAQFPKEEQCTKGLDAISTFWFETRTPEDVYRARSSIWNKCLKITNVVSLVSSWFSTGGMCDASPGIDRYHATVDAELIRTSGMELWVPASPLSNLLDSVWFTNSHPNIIDAVIASGAISPLIPPLEINGQYYVDGGVFHNLPIIKPLEQGVDRIISFLHSDIEKSEGSIISSVFEALAKKGPAVFGYFTSAIDKRMMLHAELIGACEHWSDKEILGVYPIGEPCKLTDFYAETIDKMIDMGYDSFKAKGLTDLCKFIKEELDDATTHDDDEHTFFGFHLPWHRHQKTIGGQVSEASGSNSRAIAFTFMIGGAIGIVCAVVGVKVNRVVRSKKATGPNAATARSQKDSLRTSLIGEGVESSSQ
jgi:predicted acylesterase/phospholipase RssA